MEHHHTKRTGNSYLPNLHGSLVEVCVYIVRCNIKKLLSLAIDSPSDLTTSLNYISVLHSKSMQIVAGTWQGGGNAIARS